MGSIDLNLNYISSLIKKNINDYTIYLYFFRVISWPWEITFVPLWIVLCISLVGVLYTIIFAGILLRMTEVNAEQRRTSTNSALGYSFLVIPMLVFLVLITNKLDAPKSEQWIS